MPTYNERENLPVLVAQLQALSIPNLHVLVVDDSSPDGTGMVADRLSAESRGTVSSCTGRKRMDWAGPTWRE
ncbi:glycosyltransferase [Paenarthrobacter nicotinovorans]|uniref:glycosyltransferase n=1 Tax=Paenarthrobacter nicotinovorans TaxID=29320 RepID=UPI0022B23504